MEKFSYAVEFYKNNIFSLDNVRLFKLKVKEAEEIEKYFNQVIPNVDFIRKYIIRSYEFNKSARGLRRIAYIKGLIFGENYVDLKDLFEFSEYISETLLTEPKMSLWKYKGYLHDNENEDEFEGTIEEDKLSELAVKVSSEEINFEEIDDIDELKEKIEELQNREYEDDIYEDADYDFIPVHPKEKLREFKKLVNKYIRETIKEKKINEEEVNMVKRGMKDWIKYILTSMEDVYNLNEYRLRYNDENISKYL